MDYPISTLQQLRPLLLGLRKKAGLTQAAVASLLGITQQSFAKIEANPAATSVERLFMIVRLLGGEIALSQNTDPRPSAGDAAQVVSTAKKHAGARAPAKLEPPSAEHW